jgi:hypothetical protein
MLSSSFKDYVKLVVYPLRSLRGSPFLPPLNGASKEENPINPIESFLFYISYSENTSPSMAVVAELLKESPIN